MSDQENPGTDIYGNPIGTDVQGNPKDKNVLGERPKDAEGNTLKDIYGNETNN